MKTKRCSKCREMKGLAEFYNDVHTADKLSCWCKLCVRARSKQRYATAPRVKNPVTKAVKTCPQCKETKASTEFYRAPSSSDGLGSRCKVCNSVYAKKQRFGYRDNHVIRVSKKCSRCGEIKQATEYHKNVSSRDGLSKYCKACNRTENKERYARLKVIREVTKTSKTCVACGRTLPTDAFNKYAINLDGLYGCCKECRRDYNKKLGTAYKEKEREYMIKLTKVCPQCKEMKPVAAFYKRSASSDGLSSYCKDCTSVRCKTWRATPQGQQSRAASRAREDKELVRQRQVKGMYGLTDAQYEMYRSVKVCEICGQGFSAREPQIDHDHMTGKIRGFLCGKCNRTLGQARDDPAILRKAADYLERHAVDLPEVRHLSLCERGGA